MNAGTDQEAVDWLDDIVFRGKLLAKSKVQKGCAQERVVGV